MEAPSAMKLTKSYHPEHFFTTASSTPRSPNTQHSHSNSNPNAQSLSHGYAQTRNTLVSTQEKTSLFQRVRARLGLNSMVLMVMIKGALAPTIATAILQSHAVAHHYLNLGYLMIIISILSIPILPRGKFAINMLASIFLTCLACGMVALGQWAGIKARQNTTPADAPSEVALGYNSSTSAVNAIFFVFNIFLINTLRSFRPSLTIPSIQYTIFIIVGFVYGPQEPTEVGSRTFLKELLYSFLTGQAIATGVSLLVIPVSSRQVLFVEAVDLLRSFRTLLQAQLVFVESLEFSTVSEPSIPQCLSVSGGEDSSHLQDGVSENAQKRLPYNLRAAALKSASVAVLALGVKMRDDVVFAKMEIAYGHLTSKDIHRLNLLLQGILIPISSLSTVGDISDRIFNHRVTETAKYTHLRPGERILVELSPENTEVERIEWQELAQALHGSFEPMVQVLDEGMAHVMTLFNSKSDKKGKASSNLISKKDKDGALGSHDVETGFDGPQTAVIAFGDLIDRGINHFRMQRTAQIQSWVEEKRLSSAFCTAAERARHAPEGDEENDEDLKISRWSRTERKLHIILYMDYLLVSTAEATLALVRFAESKIEDRTIRKKRLLVFPAKTIMKWIKGLFANEDSSSDRDNLDNMANNIQKTFLGDYLKDPKDPEHLPPKNSTQALGDCIRKIPLFLGSSHAKFGLRVTIATMSIGIMAFLKSTHTFFIAQRLVWALVMIAIGMNPTYGSAVFNLLGNLTATLVAMLFSYINWYIVGQKTAGIVVFMFLFMMIYFYFAARYPRFLVAIAAGAITHVLIIGYELQVRVVGLKIATATGQEYYPIYELAPFRLLVVAGGVTVAYFWTIFPVPITERSVLRRDLGVSVFLLARYLSAVSSTVDQRIRDSEGDVKLKSSRGQKLEKICRTILNQEIALLASMRQNLAFIAWEPSLGGEFPKETYKFIVEEVQNGLADDLLEKSIVNYLTVVAYASNSFVLTRSDPSTSTWLSEISRTQSVTNGTLEEVTSLLALLSGSIKNGQALPPYLSTPSSFHITDQLKATNLASIDPKYVTGPVYPAFAVIDIASLCLIDSVENILRLVRDLVGELNFRSETDSTAAKSSNGGREDIEER